MLCENCNLRQGRPTKYVLNGIATTKYLCPECSSKLIKSKLSGGLFQDNFVSGISNLFQELPDLIESIMGTPDAAGMRRTGYASLKCPKCGTTSEELFKTSYVGCPFCYEAFAPLMDEVIARSQQDSVHVGKGPFGMAGISARYQSLTAQLKKAVNEERYEEAARLKLELEELKGGQNAEK